VREARHGERAHVVLAVATTPWQHEAADLAHTAVADERWTGTLRHARIALHPGYLAELLPGAATPVDLESLLLHEIGHALGFGHVMRRDAVMFPGVNSVRRALSDDEFAAVCAVYPRVVATDPPSAVQISRTVSPGLALFALVVAGMAALMIRKP
jgi:hypothetical protein